MSTQCALVETVQQPQPGLRGGAVLSKQFQGSCCDRSAEDPLVVSEREIKRPGKIKFSGALGESRFVESGFNRCFEKKVEVVKVTKAFFELAFVKQMCGAMYERVGLAQNECVA